MGGGHPSGPAASPNQVGECRELAARKAQRRVRAELERERRASVALVHVGKCAGMTAMQALNSVPLSYTHIHMQESEKWNPSDFDIFVVLTREPASRTISAFNYMHPYGGNADFKAPDGSQLLGPQTAKMYACFNQSRGAANAFAEALSKGALASLKTIVVDAKHERHPQLLAACQPRGIEIA